MKLKLITLALGVAATGAVIAAPATDAQVNQLQTQLQRLQSQVSALQSGKAAPKAPKGDASAFIGTYAPLTWQMQSNYAPVGREMFILQARKAGNVGNGAVYFGGYAKADALWQITNASSVNQRFRNPVFYSDGDTNNNENASGVQLTSVNLSALATINQWAAGYMQVGTEYVGSNSSFGGGENVQFQQAYLLLGDLTQQPVYGFVGLKDIDFGSFGSVNMYSQPLNRLLFAAAGNTIGVGYTGYNANVVLSAINGGTESASRNANTADSATLNNFAINANYGDTTNGADWKVGAGYLQGVSRQWSRNNTGGTNGAWDINGQLSVMNFDVMAEYTATTSNYTTTNKKIQSWNVGAAYNFPFMGRDSKFSVGYSQAKGIATAKDFYQWVVGFRNQVMPNVWGGIEYSYNQGILVPKADGTVFSRTVPYSLSAHANRNNNTVLFDITAAF